MQQVQCCPMCNNKWANLNSSANEMVLNCQFPSKQQHQINISASCDFATYSCDGGEVDEGTVHGYLIVCDLTPGSMEVWKSYMKATMHGYWKRPHLYTPSSSSCIGVTTSTTVSLSASSHPLQNKYQEGTAKNQIWRSPFWFKTLAHCGQDLSWRVSEKLKKTHFDMLGQHLEARYKISLCV